MPYIEQRLRDELAYDLEALLDRVEQIVKEEPATRPGIQNYVISTLLWNHMKDTPRYYKLNEAIGVLACAQLELYRRLGSVLEDKAIEKNGDLNFGGNYIDWL